MLAVLTFAAGVLELLNGLVANMSKHAKVENRANNGMCYELTCKTEMLSHRAISEKYRQSTSIIYPNPCAFC